MLELSARRGGNSSAARADKPPSIIAPAADLVIVLDDRGIVTDVGESLGDLVGAEPDDWIGRRLTDLIELDDRAVVARAVTTATDLAPGDVERALFRVRRPDESTVWIQARMGNLLDDEAVEGVVAVVWDETERVTGALGLSDTEERLESFAASPVETLVARVEEAEARLGESEAWFRSLVDHALDIVSVSDADGRLTYISPATTEVLGYDTDELLRGDVGLPIVHPDDLEMVVAAQKEARSTPGGAARLAYRVRHQNGQWRWIDSRVTNMLDDPAVRGIVTNSRDITDQRIAEEARARVDSTLLALVDASPLGIVVVEEDGSIQMWNHASEMLFGWPAPDVLGRSLPFVPSAESGAAAELLARVFAGESLTGLERRRTRRDGSPLEVSLSAGPVRDRGGRVVSAILVYADITARREAERALRSSGERLRALVEHASDFLLVVSPDRSVSYSSPSFTRFIGFDAVAALDRAAAVVPHPDDLARVAAVRDYVLSGPQRSRTFEARLRRHDGLWRWMEITATNVLADPDVSGVVLNMRDVTDRREAENALRESEERFRALVQEGTDVITVVDADGAIRYTSPAAQRIFGFEAGDSSSTDPLSRVHPDDADEMVRRMAGHLAGGETEPIPFRLRSADGSWRDVESTAKNLLDDPAVGGILITTRDVTERRRAETLLATSAAVLEMVARGNEMPDTLGALCTVVDDAIEEAVSAVMTVGSARRRLVLTASPNLPPVLRDALSGGLEIGEGNGACGTAASRQAEVIAGRVADDPSVGELRAVLQEAGISACWSIPILASTDGHLLGTFSVYWAQAREPTEDDRVLVDSMVNLAAIAIEHKTSDEQLEYQANHDPLTGLPNRALFLEFLSVALARARRRRTATAVLFLDLDSFKLFNDSMGHEQGDELLVAVGKRLRDALRPGDTIARFGGDEFTVLCDDLKGPDARQQAIDVAERILESLAQPFSLGGIEQFLTASIGISLATRGFEVPEHLLRDADAAMYRAKDHGKDRWELFDERMRARARERLETESALHRALERGEFQLFYQPIVALDDLRYVGVEALIRWKHPDRGLLAPGDFIPLAEETGLIVPLGAWVLDEVGRQFALWSENPRFDPSMVISVNLSARQISHPEIVETVAKVFEADVLRPQNLCLEITESVLLDDAGAALKTLTRLKELGVTLSMDDFGTGYSSLGYLKRFPIDSVKVDRSFIDGLGRDPQDSAIVAGVVGLGYSLALTVVAEGVESEEQIDALVTLGCDQAQGFLFSPPRPADEIERLLMGGGPALGLPRAGRESVGNGRARPGGRPGSI